MKKESENPDLRLHSPTHPGSASARPAHTSRGRNTPRTGPPPRPPHPAKRVECVGRMPSLCPSAGAPVVMMYFNSEFYLTPFVAFPDPRYGEGECNKQSMPKPKAQKNEKRGELQFPFERSGQKLCLGNWGDFNLLQEKNLLSVTIYHAVWYIV